MTSIKIRLNVSRKDKDGRYPLIIQLICNRKKREIYMPYRLHKEEFNPKKETLRAGNRTKERVTYIREATEYAARLKENLVTICNTLDTAGKDYTVDDIILMYTRYNDLNNIFVFTDYLTSELKEEGKDGTSANYRSAISAFAEFMNDPLFTFNKLTPRLVEQYQNFLRHKKCEPNTRWAYLYQLRAIYNRAIAMGVVLPGIDPFSEVTIKREKTAKRAITANQVLMIEQADLSKKGELMLLARDLFMFSFFARGIAFVDMCYLEKKNLRLNYLSYRRRKTGQLLVMKVEPSLQQLIDKYADPSSPYLLPMLREDDSYMSYRTIQRKLNKRILKVGQILKFPFSLNFYAARHTWASLAQEAGIPLSVISPSLGHNAEATTRNYLTLIHQNVLDDANRRVIKSYKKKRK